MTFLPKLPVIFFKDSFNAMFKHTKKSIDEINLTQDGRQITRDQMFDDKALHIKKSAELALHIKSLIGPAHLAYGITMAVGLIKEALDGSFLNPNGSREKADLKADHVGAMAVFGEKKFDKSLQKHVGAFIKPLTSEAVEPSTQIEANGEISAPLRLSAPNAVSPKNTEPEQNRQDLVKQYYEAVSKGDSARAQELSKLLQ